MKAPFLVLIIILCSYINCSSQKSKASYENYFREGCILQSVEDYENALIYFEKAYKIDSTSANINYQIGLCFINSLTKKAYAERYLTKAVRDINSNYIEDEANERCAPPLALLYYGRALHVNYKFKEALIHYKLFKSIYAKHILLQQRVNYYEKQTLYAVEKTTVPLTVNVEKISDSASKEYENYSSFIGMDDKTIIYKIIKNMSANPQDLFINPDSETVFVSYKNLNGKWISDGTPQRQFKQKDSSLNQPRQTSVLLKALSENDGNVYYNIWDGFNWRSIQEFDSDINTQNWEGQAYLNPSGNTLYFVSDRAGGYGGRDIYRCIKLPNGKWSKPLNLGPNINTEFDEGRPYIHPDGLTFVFTSQGHQTMGGFDIFFSIIDADKTFSKVENMGYPINTTDDDVFFVSSADGKSIYFSSSKNSELEKKDIYKMAVSKPHDEPLAICKGLIKAEKGETLPDDIVIIVTNPDDGIIVGTYKPKRNGSYIAVLTPDKHYVFSYQLNGEEFCHDKIFISPAFDYQITKKEIALETITVFDTKKIPTYRK